MINFKTLIVTGSALLILLSGCFKDEHPGKMHFKNSKFAGSTNSKSCNYCHNEGSGLENAGKKTTFNVEGTNYASIEQLINQVMITNYLKGRPIDENSQEMSELVDYLRTLK